jgi:CRISPR/Cas system-associated endonuclease Cas1
MSEASRRVNALIPMGYSMLAKELTGVCHSVRLDPFLGFMHQPRYGRPVLALDLMEEFRRLVADSLAISIINRGEIGPEDSIKSASGTSMNDHGFRNQLDRAVVVFPAVSSFFRILRRSIASFVVMEVARQNSSVRSASSSLPPCPWFQFVPLPTPFCCPDLFAIAPSPASRSP